MVWTWQLSAPGDHLGRRRLEYGQNDRKVKMTMKKLESKSTRVIELSQKTFEDWSKLSSSGRIRHIAYDATLTEAHDIAASRISNGATSYRRELGRQAEIPGKRLVGENGLNPELMALGTRQDTERLAELRAKAPPMAELARWEAFQSPADRLPLGSVKEAIADAKASKGKLTGKWRDQGYWAGFNYYIPVGDIKVESVLPPPPAEGSREHTADLNVVRAAQAERTEDRVARVKADAEMNIFRFADVLGDKFKPENMPFAADFLQQAFIDGDNAINRVKRDHARRRPFMVDPSIPTIVNRPENASYPSGHSAFGNFGALVLSHMFPEHSHAIEERGKEYAWNRVIAGVHFPTDIEGGHRAAKFTFDRLKAVPEFADDLARATREARAAMGLPPIDPHDDHSHGQLKNESARPRRRADV